MDAFFFEARTRDAPGRRAVLASMLPRLEGMELGGDMSVEEAEERLESASRMAWAVEVVALRARGPRERAEVEDLRARLAAVRRSLARALGR